MVYHFVQGNVYLPPSPLLLLSFSFCTDVVLAAEYNVFDFDVYRRQMGARRLLPAHALASQHYDGKLVHDAHGVRY